MSEIEESRVFEDLKSEGNILVFDKDWKLITVARDEYNQLRWLKHNAERIYFEFDNGDKVQETFDPRIFNCFYYIPRTDGSKEEVIVTTRAESSNELCKCIKNKANDSFRGMLLQEHFKGKEREYMVAYFKNDLPKEQVERIKIVQIPKKDKHGYDITVCYYIIDEILMVDDKGTSYMLNMELEERRKKGQNIDEQLNQEARNTYTHEGDNDDHKLVDKKRWDFLCTVLKEDWGVGQVNTNLGVVTVNKTMQTIITKVRYLMDIDPNDDVTMNQLRDQQPKIYKYVMDGIEHGR